MAAATLIGGSGYRMLQQILADWGRARHRGYKRHLTQVIWPRKVAPLRELLALDFLDLRMDQTHGHSSCCGMVVSALSGFAPGFAKGVPSRVNISKCSLQRFCAVCRMTPDDCDCGIGYSAAVQERMKLWTQQREKGSYSVKEGFHLMDPVFQGVKGEEDDNGNW
ncbi:hypothetical protein MMC32_003540 [Xylographa parallela]|nr:hypothetical protein [Xylographa parallela]